MAKKDAFSALIITNYDQFEDGETDALWNQGVDLDDWDVLLFIEDPNATLLEEETIADWQGEPETSYTPHDYQLEKMVQGCCCNNWYPKINFRGKVYTLGAAHHA